MTTELQSPSAGCASSPRIGPRLPTRRQTNQCRLAGALVGGIGTLAPDKTPIKTVGSFWPYATTLFDYIRRAMPFQESKSLTADELYAVSAYILNLNGIVGSNDVIDAQSLPNVRMPNRDGFIPFPRNPK
jgi:S-disulfanyl-L-cysteine oxidoreductase SoxD